MTLRRRYMLLLLLLSGCATDNLHLSPLGVKYEVPSGWAVVSPAELREFIKRDLRRTPRNAEEQRGVQFVAHLSRQQHIELLTRDGRMPPHPQYKHDAIVVMKFPFSFNLGENHQVVMEALCSPKPGAGTKTTCSTVRIGDRHVLKMRKSPANVVDSFMPEMLVVPMPGGFSVAFIAFIPSDMSDMNKHGVTNAVNQLISTIRSSDSAH